MKRSRGRGRRQQNSVNRSYDSNGPDVRVRGTASQVYDKYQALARDAMSAGDRVMSENYLQLAEHYYRIVLTNQPPQTEQVDQVSGVDKEADGPVEGEADASGAAPLVLSRGGNEGDGETSGKSSRRRGPLRRRRNDEGGDEKGDQAKAVAPQKTAEPSAADDTGETDETVNVQTENVQALPLESGVAEDAAEISADDVSAAANE